MEHIDIYLSISVMDFPWPFPSGGGGLQRLQGQVLLRDAGRHPLRTHQQHGLQRGLSLGDLAAPGGWRMTGWW